MFKLNPSYLAILPTITFEKTARVAVEIHLPEPYKFLILCEQGSFALYNKDGNPQATSISYVVHHFSQEIMRGEPLGSFGLHTDHDSLYFGVEADESLAANVRKAVDAMNEHLSKKHEELHSGAATA